MSDDDAREQIGWSIVLLGRLYRREMDRCLQGFGLSQAAATPLRYLAKHREPLRHGVLAEALSLEGPTLVGVLDQLEQQGFVRRIEDPADRRARLIELTPAGTALNLRIQSVLRETRSKLFNDVSAAQLEACDAVLNVLDQNLRLSKAT